MINVQAINSSDYKVISIMKYILALLVVTIHLETSNAHVIDNSWGFGKVVYYVINILISRNFSNAAVPAFFFISGYLYFVNVKDFTFDTYKLEFKTRVHTLLVPYLFWNLMAYLFALLQSKFSADVFVPGFFEAFTYDWTDGVALYTPICGPLWFIRDLFFQVLTIPLLFLIDKNNKKLHLLILVIITFLYFFGLNIFCFNPQAYMFFTLGAVIGVKKLSVTNMLWDKKYICMFFSLISFAILLYSNMTSMQGWSANLIYNIWPFFFIPLIFILSTFLTKKNCSIPAFLLNSTFILYAVHSNFVIQPLYKFGYKTLHLEEYIWGVNGVYIAAFLTAIIVSIALSVLVRRFIPKCLPLLTGGR